MSSFKANIFLERARRLNSASQGKTSPGKKTPVRSVEKRIAKFTSDENPKMKEAQLAKKNVNSSFTSNLELMIEDFLQSRYKSHENLEKSKERDSRTVRELKQLLEYEIEKSKSHESQEIEKNYKEKAEKILMVVKQEAMSMDKKLMMIKDENTKLKKMLSEKKIELVDRKISFSSNDAHDVIEKNAEKHVNTGTLEEAELVLELQESNSEEFDKMVEDICEKNYTEFSYGLSKLIAHYQSVGTEELNRLGNSLKLSRERILELNEKIAVAEDQARFSVSHSSKLDDLTYTENYSSNMENSFNSEPVALDNIENVIKNRDTRTFSVTDEVFYIDPGPVQSDLNSKSSVYKL